MFRNVLVPVLLSVVSSMYAQAPGRIEGSVVLGDAGEALAGASVHLAELGRDAEADEEGRYRFEAVPPGTYLLSAHVSSAFTEGSQRVTVEAGSTVTADFHLQLATVQQDITVTASGREVSTFDSFQSVDSRTSLDLAGEIAPGLGETLANRPGNSVAKRSFGPGTERPVIRGFDGDRVLVMQDGVRTGTLSSQSGDHGELINTATLDRLEVVKGPATLLYGGSAVGGVVNAISRHHAIHEHPHQGFRGFLSGSGGTANAFGNGSLGLEYGLGRWMVWGSGSGQRSGDYSTPEGKVPNSDTRLYNGEIGFGYYADRTSISFSGGYDQGIYGVPYANVLHVHDHEHEAEEDDEHDHEHEAEEEEEHEHELERVELDARRQSYQLQWGLHHMRRAVSDFSLRLRYNRWLHDEVEVMEDGDTLVGTHFDNKQFVYRGQFEQVERGPLTGRFGFWGMARNYSSAGEEALSPPVDQNAIAGFALEELDFSPVKLQFGARLEHNGYTPGLRPAEGDEMPAPSQERSFTGVSLAGGINVSLWEGGRTVVNYTRSYRPPALEELYNQGAHVGNLAWEVGDENLMPEKGNGIDVSLRHQLGKVDAELNYFYYAFSDFVFPFANGEFEHGLQVIQYAQADSRFTGGEASLGYRLNNLLTLNLGIDYVNAREKRSDIHLPRIPPLRGRVGFDIQRGGLSVEPEMVLVDRQALTFTNETQTAGYTLFNIKASYTVARGRLIHQIAVNSFNLGDRLYRNHSSFIKHLAPEIGRGVRVTYQVRFF